MTPTDGCALCPQRSPNTQWTPVEIPRAVVTRDIFDDQHMTTAPGQYRLCPDCSTWLTTRAGEAPPAVMEEVVRLAAAASASPVTRQAARDQMLQHVQAVADAMVPAAAGGTEGER